MSLRYPQETALRYPRGSYYLVYSQNSRSTQFPLCQDLHIGTFTWMQIEATSASKKNFYMDLLQERSREAKHWKAPKQKLFKIAYLANLNDIIQNKNDNETGESLPQNYNCKQCLNIHKRKDANEIACSKA